MKDTVEAIKDEGDQVKKRRYTTWGSVRGSCQHRHLTIEAATRCLEADSKDCRSAGGYTDRSVYIIFSRTGCVSPLDLVSIEDAY